jgi:hypothetical protein
VEDCGVKFRSRRLETLFNTDLDSIGVAELERLVEGEVPEAEDLEFKQQSYVGEKGHGDLASDVAAMANTRGGLIVVGIRDIDDRAGELTPIPLPSTERERLTQIVATRISPPVEFDIRLIVDEERSKEMADGPRGYVLIGIARSARAPHAAMFSEKLRYSRRVGSHTRHLAEPEVAAAYRARDLYANMRSRRLSELQTAAAELIDRTDYPWLIATAVPELPGDFQVDDESYARSRDTLMNRDAGLVFPVGASIYRVRVGKQRIWADGQLSASAASRWARFELWADGSSVIASAIPAKQRFTTSDVEGDYVRDVDLMFGVINAVQRAAQHAFFAASAGGDLLMDVRILPSRDTNQIVLTHARDSFGDARSTTMSTPGDLFAETFAPLDSLVPLGAPLLAVCADICNQLGQALGIPSFGYLDRNGELVDGVWSPEDLARIRAHMTLN